MAYVWEIGLTYELSKFTMKMYDLIYNKKEPVHIIGNGWASYYFAKNLDKRKFNPIIIAPNIKVLDTPKLINLVTDPKANVEFENPYGQIISDTLDDFDNDKKILYTKSGKRISYKYLVLAIGSEPNDFGILGVSTYAYTLKTIPDANKIREKLNLGNELKLKSIYIIGSGPTGIELSSKILKYGTNVGIIEGLDSILIGFNVKSKQDIQTYLSDKKINLYLENFVKSIDSNTIYTNKTKFTYDLVVWTGGIKFNGYGKTQLFKSLNTIQTIKPRGLDTNDNFTIGQTTNIFCIGDMVANHGPPTAQNAKLQAEWLAKYFNNNLNNVWANTANNKFKVLEKGKLLHLDDTMYLETNDYKGFVSNWFKWIFDVFM